MIHTGVIVTFQERKGWGFIESRDDGGGRWFFHRDNCQKGFQPRLGVSVTFLIGPPLTLGKSDQAVEVCEVQS
jgi:cold shock CspA family protein